MFTGTLDRAILETLAYSDIFEYPLRLDELHRYLPVYVDRQELPIRLRSLIGQVGEMDGFYFLAGRHDIAGIRKQREERSRGLLPPAFRYGRVLGLLPFVRMVALTGSLAVLNVSKNVDFDYMLVAAPGRVWTARAFALLLNRFTRLFGHTLCPNLIVSETSLEWHQRDLYSAHELCQMIPISGLAFYRKLMGANEWVKDFLPNADLSLREARSATTAARTYGRQSPVGDGRLLHRSFQLLLAMTEGLLHGGPGDRFERWEMNRKIARFSRQDDFGEETIFSADMCQGNFDHHRKWTREMFDRKLENFVPADPETSEWVKQSSTHAEIASLRSQ